MTNNVARSGKAPPPPPPRFNSEAKRFREAIKASETGKVKLNPIFKDINSIKTTITSKLKPNCNLETKLQLTDQKITEIATRIFQKKDEQIDRKDKDFKSIIQLNVYAPTATVSLMPAQPPSAQPFSTLTQTSSTDTNSKSAAPITPSASSTPPIKENEVDIFGQKFYLTKWKMIKGNKISVPITNDDEKKAWVDNIKALLTANKIKDESTMTEKGVKNINLTFGLNDINEFDFSKKANIKYTDKDGKEEVILKGEKIFSEEYSVLDKNIQIALYNFISTSKDYKFNFTNDKTTSSTSIPKGIKGAINTHNNCFIIAALQAIVADKELKAFFKTSDNENKIIEAYDKDGSEAIDDQLVQNIRAPLKSLIKEIKDNNTGDAKEVIFILKSLVPTAIKTKFITTFQALDNDQLEKNKEDPFIGAIKIPVNTNELNKANVESFLSMQVLKTQTESSQIEFEGKDGLKKAKKIHEKYTFSAIPNTFDIQLDKHPASQSIKIETSLVNLELLTENNSKHSPTTYELQSIICYQGDGINGHYNTIIKKDTQWYQLNDATVTQLNEDKALELASTNAVYLSYTKAQTPA
jgi:hypothetical protein